MSGTSQLYTLSTKDKAVRIVNLTNQPQNLQLTSPVFIEHTFTISEALLSKICYCEILKLAAIDSTVLYTRSNLVTGIRLLLEPQFFRSVHRSNIRIMKIGKKGENDYLIYSRENLNLKRWAMVTSILKIPHETIQRYLPSSLASLFRTENRILLTSYRRLEGSALNSRNRAVRNRATYFCSEHKNNMDRLDLCMLHLSNILKRQ